MYNIKNSQKQSMCIATLTDLKRAYMIRSSFGARNVNNE